AAVAARQPCVLVVPEQYSHGAERQLLRVCGDSFSLYGDVLSFTRLSLRIREEFGDGAQPLSPGGYLLGLYRAANQLSDQLCVYGSGAKSAEFLERLAASLRELKNAGITAENLESAARSSGGTLSKKLSDMSLLSAGLDAVLRGDGTLDTTDAISRAAETLHATSFTQYKYWFDGFSDFTAPEARVAESLICSGADLTFCLTCDSLSAGEEQFAPARGTAARIISAARARGIEVRTDRVDGGREFDAPAEYIKLLTAADPLSECEAAAAIALDLAAAGYRWSDIAVMSRDASPYGELCEAVLARFGIPAFRSGRADILKKPPVRLILSAFEIDGSGWDYDAVMRYVKTGLAGLSPAECDELENYAYRFNIRGAVWYRERPWAFGKSDSSRADALRKRAALPLRRMLAECKKAADCGGKLRALYDFLENIGFADSLDSFALELRLRGELRLADEYAQLWEIIVSALDQMYGALGNTPIGDTEFRRLLQILLSQYDVGVIPVALDRVTVGDFTLSRRRDIKALIVLGATDELIPKAPDPAGLFSQTERDAMSGLGLELHFSPEEQYAAELNVIYSALTLPEERLYILRPTGGDTQPSFISERLRQRRSLTVTAVNPPELAARAPIPYGEYLAQMRPLTLTLPDTIGAETARRLYGDAPRFSVTRAERFADCRFKYFMEYGLRLRPRRRYELDAATSGTYIHGIIENVSKSAEQYGGLGGIELTELLFLTKKHALEALEQEFPDISERDARMRYLAARLASDSARIAEDLAREMRASDFRPAAYEREFSLDLGALRIKGKIDRIDSWARGGVTYLRVLDYKTGAKSFDYSEILHGKGLQPLVYLAALRADPTSRGAVSCGALYIPARDDIVAAERSYGDEAI
ncbi:MAG: PD-(D/E)XK nuclease family protein, partial [Oscillospiraceae bacterium]|nr:PD-(D/E)XK nuclease family protein [Oscillospiraceae bacterium]